MKSLLQQRIIGTMLAVAMLIPISCSKDEESGITTARLEGTWILREEAQSVSWKEGSSYNVQYSDNKLYNVSDEEYKLILKKDGTCEIVVKDTFGEYAGGEYAGTWQLKGDKVVFSWNDGEVEDVTIVSVHNSELVMEVILYTDELKLADMVIANAGYGYTMFFQKK